MKRVLITGATGFIGGHTLDHFLQNGYQVRALVRPGNIREQELRRKNVEIVLGDIRDYDLVASAMPGVDIVVHCAAVVTDWAPKSDFEEVTVGGTRNVCRAASRENVQRLVHISTNDVFGLSEKRILDESCPMEPWGEPYPDYKIKAEEICRLFHKEQHLPLTIIYPCWVYGKNDFTFTADLADAIIKKEMIFWRKHAIIWPTYINNLTDLIMTVSENDKAIGNGYLVHDGESVTLQDFSRKIAETLAVEPVTTHIPYPAAYGYAMLLELSHKLLRKKTRPLLTTYLVKNLGSRLRFSIAKARIDLDWRPAIPFSEGFRQTMAWLKTVDRNKLKTK